MANENDDNDDIEALRRYLLSHPSADQGPGHPIGSFTAPNRDAYDPWMAAARPGLCQSSHHKPAGYRYGVDITRIPPIMRRHNCLNGARLQDVWFAGPANSDPARGTPDTTTIRMDTWALTFQRARDVYNNLVRDKIWANAAAHDVILRMLNRQGKLGTAPA